MTPQHATPNLRADNFSLMLRRFGKPRFGPSTHWHMFYYRNTVSGDILPIQTIAASPVLAYAHPRTDTHDLGVYPLCAGGNTGILSVARKEDRMHFIPGKGLCSIYENKLSQAGNEVTQFPFGGNQTCIELNGSGNLVLALTQDESSQVRELHSFDFSTKIVTKIPLAS